MHCCYMHNISSYLGILLPAIVQINWQRRYSNPLSRTPFPLPHPSTAGVARHPGIRRTVLGSPLRHQSQNDTWLLQIRSTLLRTFGVHANFHLSKIQKFKIRSQAKLSNSQCPLENFLIHHFNADAVKSAPGRAYKTDRWS